MREPAKVVLVTFAGRRDRMALLTSYAEAAMRRGLVDDWHVWNFARDPLDSDWLQACFPAIRRTPDDRIYRPAGLELLAEAEQVLRFRVRCARDAHLALISTSRGPSYELILGGWENSQSALRVWPPGMVPDHGRRLDPPTTCLPTPGLLSGRAWRDVEVRLTWQRGIQAIDLDVAGRTILTFQAPQDTVQGFRVEVMSGYGGEADWAFAAHQNVQAGLFYAATDPRLRLWSRVYQYYARRAEDYADTVFLKCDDDIVYLDLERLADFIAYRRQNTEYFLVSANVVNNGVCAHAQQQLGMIPDDIGVLELPPGGFRGSLWESGQKAEALHHCFLRDPDRFRCESPVAFTLAMRLSINFVSWLGADLPLLDARFDDDEHDLTVTVPEFAERLNVVYLPFVVAHLSFWSQDKQMDVAALLSKYQVLAKRLGILTLPTLAETIEVQALDPREDKLLPSMAE